MAKRPQNLNVVQGIMGSDTFDIFPLIFGCITVLSVKAQKAQSFVFTTNRKVNSLVFLT